MAGVIGTPRQHLQVHHTELAQIPLAPSFKFSIQLLGDPAHRALAQATGTQGFPVKLPDVLCGQAAHVSVPQQLASIIATEVPQY